MIQKCAAADVTRFSAGSGGKLYSAGFLPAADGTLVEIALFDRDIPGHSHLISVFILKRAPDSLELRWFLNVVNKDGFPARPKGDTNRCSHALQLLIVVAQAVYLLKTI